MRFRVHAADPGTGREFDWECEAATIQEAERKAQEAGMLVSAVVPISEAPSPPPRQPQPRPVPRRPAKKKTSPFTWLVAIVIVLICFGVFSSQLSTTTPQRPTSAQRPQRPKTAKPREWYQGGNLHDKTVAEFRQASYRNQLATCSDWVVVAHRQSGFTDTQIATLLSNGTLKDRAMDLAECIQVGTADGIIDNQNASTAATLCTVLLGYNLDG